MIFKGSAVALVTPFDENGNVIYIKSAKVNVKINNVGTLLTVDCDINTAFTK